MEKLFRVIGHFALVVTISTACSHKPRVLEEVRVQSAELGPSRAVAAAAAKLELRLASTEPVENWKLTKDPLFVDDHAILISQDVEALSLQKQKWSELSTGTRTQLERLPASVMAIPRDEPVYS